MGMKRQVQTLSRTGCLVSNGFIHSFSICLHFYPHLVQAPFSAPPACLPACPPRISHQRVPVSTFLRSSCSSVLNPHLHPQCPSLRSDPYSSLWPTLRCKICSCPPLCPHFLSLLMAVFPTHQARSCFLAFAWTAPSSGTILKLDIEMASSLLPPALCSNAVFPWGL